MKTSPGTQHDKYVLTEEAIRQMLEDPEFYVECVAFSFLRKIGLAAAQQYVKAVQSRASEGRTWGELQLVIGSFVKHVNNLYELGPDLLKPLRDYIATCLGYQPDEVVLRYKEQGEETELIF